MSNHRPATIPPPLILYGTRLNSRHRPNSCQLEICQLSMSIPWIDSSWSQCLIAPRPLVSPRPSMLCCSCPAPALPCVRRQIVDTHYDPPFNQTPTSIHPVHQNGSRPTRTRPLALLLSAWAVLFDKHIPSGWPICVAIWHRPIILVRGCRALVLSWKPLPLGWCVDTPTALLRQRRGPRQTAAGARK